MKDKQKGSLSIRFEIFLLSFLFLALVSLVFAGIFLRILYQKNMDSAQNSLRECNSQIVIYTEGMFHENASMVGILSRDVTVISAGGDNPAAVLDIYDAILRDNTNITYLYSGYADGRLFISDYDKPEDYDPTGRPWYQAAAGTEGVARLVYADAATGEWLFSQSKKLVDGQGNMVGAVCIDCSNESISRQLSARYQYQSQRSYILDPGGTVLIHPEERYINDSILHYMQPGVWAEVTAGRSNYGEYEKSGVQAMAYFERIPETNFFVATAIDAQEVTRPIVRSVEFLLVLVVGLSILLALILSQLLLYRFARPIMALHERIARVAAGRAEPGGDVPFANAEIQGIADGIELLVRDIARREEQRKTAEYLSFHDSMTGLYNRRFFAEEQRRLDVPRSYPLCIICCDVNGLKLVNDIFGHDIGDRLLCRVAESLAGACRADDILARVGGDEFSLLLPRTPAAAAQDIIARVQASFREEIIHGVEVSASLGYALKGEASVPLEEVARLADQMMYGRKLVESAEMRRRIVANLIAAAGAEGLIRPLTSTETRVLERLAEAKCPGERELLLSSYRLRDIGLCSLFQSSAAPGGDRRHTENGYRLLSATDEYRSEAGYILHYTEHWDGSGWPAGLSGPDIPLLSRILAVIDACAAANGEGRVLERHRAWYDPELLDILFRDAPERREADG